jgi:hypothetical protein
VDIIGPMAQYYNFWTTPTGSATGSGRRATFADGGPVLGGKNAGDVYPITSGNPPVSRPSRPGVMFQVAPTKEACDKTLAQSTFTAGLLAAFADGSVRLLSPGIAPEVYGGAVTPAGGEVLSDF